MIVKTFDNTEDWQNARIGKITGSKLKDLITKRGTGKKIGFYQLIADRLAVPADEENVMDRGHRLEEEAIEKFTEESGIKIDTSLVIWSREDNEDIAISPDGFTEDMKVAVEVKCLGSARHIEALVTNAVPKDYEDQVLQYFVVNDQLETVFMAFYDPRLLCKQFFCLKIDRDQAKVDEYLEMERAILVEVDNIVAELAEF